MMNFCNDNNPKIIYVEFDSGLLKRKDEWELCVKCNLKPEFQKHRISEKRLGGL